jgi:lipid II isoglutaminyl synthase (glutamine-hydrolysing)
MDIRGQRQRTMYSVRLTFAIVCAHLVARLVRLLRIGAGTALPGRVAVALCPGIAASFARQLCDGVILITGTNGKTTTTALVSAAARAHGVKVITNAEGANLVSGIVSALVGGANLRGRSDATMAVFEVDEAALGKACELLKPRVVVVLNLFRDQLDRHAELDVLAARMASVVREGASALLLNADDPIVTSIGTHLSLGRTVSFFGVSPSVGATFTDVTVVGDCEHCPACGFLLDYAQHYYAHLGDYICSRCGFMRPLPRTSVVGLGAVGATSGTGDRSATSVRIAVPHAMATVRRPAAGPAEAYSTAATLGVCDLLGWSMPESARAITGCPPPAGRGETVRVGDTQVQLVLVKNPAGMAISLRTHALADPHVPILLAINDDTADGHDSSWIWDAPLELLSDHLGLIVAAGDRAQDVAVRLRYADVSSEVCTFAPDAIERLLEDARATKRGLVLANYTAMVELRKAIGRERSRERVGVRL